MSAEHGETAARRQLKHDFRVRAGIARVSTSNISSRHFEIRRIQQTPTQMKPAQLKQLSNLCFALGFLSILGSIAIWFLTGGTAAETQAHAERFGVFVGLWAPTFFILSNRFDRYAEKVS